MLLKNFGAYCATAFGNRTLQSGLKTTTGQFPLANSLKYLSRNLTIDGIVTNNEYTNNTSSNYPGWYIIFGNGTTPPTVDDYKLSGDLIEELTLSYSAIMNGSNGSTWSFTVTNGTNVVKTISEIGLCQAANGSGCVMLTRDVLPEPVILEAGASRVFEIFIDTQSFVEQQVLQGDN